MAFSSPWPLIISKRTLGAWAFWLFIPLALPAWTLLGQVSERPPFNEAQLHRAENLGLLLLETARVQIYDFPEWETVGLKDLPQRLHETDPRYDPYLRRLTRLFWGERNGQALRLAYVPPDLSAEDLFGQWPELESLGWTPLPAVSTDQPFLSWQGLIWLPLWTGLWFWIFRRRRKVFSLMTLLSLPALAVPWLIPLFSLAWPGVYWWDRRYEAWFRRARSREGALVQEPKSGYFWAGMGLGTLGSLWAAPHLTGWVPVGLILGLIWGIQFAVKRIWTLRRSALLHPVFEPLPLRSKAKTLWTAEKLLMGSAWLLTSVFMVGPPAQALGDRWPVWQETPEFNRDLAGWLNSPRASAEWPDPAEFWAHRRFQQGFGLGLEYQPFRLGDSISRFAVRRTGPGFSEQVQEALTFDQAWAEKTLTELSAFDPARLWSQRPQSGYWKEVSVLQGGAAPVPWIWWLGLSFLSGFAMLLRNEILQRLRPRRS